MNGPDDPSAQDALFRIVPGTDYRFPFCYNEGPPGGTGSEVAVAPNPKFPNEDCTAVPPATALLGWHVCATGLDFPTAGPSAFPEPFQSAVYVGECTAFFAEDLVQRDVETLQGDDPTRVSHNTSHKVVRVSLDSNGNATEVHDFLTGLVLSTDVLFGPDGAMYVADAEGVLRVAPASMSAGPTPSPPSPAATVAAIGAQFVPAVITVPAGTTVQWQGLLLAHTVETANSPQDAIGGVANDPNDTDGDPDTFSADLPMSGTVMHTFETPGVFHYFCQPHHELGMIGTVIVQ
jgi:plastocyanin